MVVRIPGPVVVLDGRDNAILNTYFGEFVVALARRDGYVPAELTRIVEEIRRAALQFRADMLAKPQVEPGRGSDPGTALDAASSVTRASGVSERLTAAEAAQLAGVTPRMIRALAFKSVLKGTRTGHGGSWVLDADSVAAWQAGRVERANRAA